jgi:group II intron reverse transcriptase/maturase
MASGQTLKSSQLQRTTKMEIKAKPIKISKQLVWDAWKRVKANAGSAGIDGQSISDFEEDLGRQLYKLWNRMSSGSYFPPPVVGVEIPKRSGGTRLLGIPAVADRIAQTVIARLIEPRLEQVFHSDSYGYRPGKSTHHAIEVTRRRCWKYWSVLEYDIKGLFDNLSHELLMKAVRTHINETWIHCYIERWLKAPMILNDGQKLMREKGTPQGGVISPLLSNLFLHYAIDAWMAREYPHVPFVRYADDGLMHCKSRKQAEYIREQLQKRLLAVGLEMHPDKTRIVYCSTDGYDKSVDCRSFLFLGYEFKMRSAKNSQDGRIFSSFLPAIGRDRLNELKMRVRQEFRTLRMTHVSLNDIAAEINAVVRGWLGAYGAFHRSALIPLRRYLNECLMRWCRKKFLSLKISRKKAFQFLCRIAERNPKLFAHWEDTGFVS